jgi:propanediol dehydratase large subunit
MTAERPVGRIRFMDRQRVNLDGFAIEDPELGLTAFGLPHDPEPSLVVTGGRVTELDGVPEAEFDSIDTYIARHGLDLSVAEEVMALADVAFARLLVDPAVPRPEIIRLSAGATPAKLARVLALLRPPELGLAMTKLRARRTPGNQAHVTNRLDDPLLLAADAATAAAFGFREIETTRRPGCSRSTGPADCCRSAGTTDRANGGRSGCGSRSRCWPVIFCARCERSGRTRARFSWWAVPLVTRSCSA